MCVCVCVCVCFQVYKLYIHEDESSAVQHAYMMKCHLYMVHMFQVDEGLERAQRLLKQSQKKRLLQDIRSFKVSYNVC